MNVKDARPDMLTRAQTQTLRRYMGISRKITVAHGVAACPDCGTLAIIDACFGDFIVRCGNPECKFYKSQEDVT